MIDLSPAEQDELWLKKHCPNATEEQLDFFVERVAILWDGGLSDAEARDQALGLLKQRSGI